MKLSQAAGASKDERAGRSSKRTATVAKAAAATLAAVTAPQAILALGAEFVALFNKVVPGVGAETAERMVMAEHAAQVKAVSKSVAVTGATITESATGYDAILRVHFAVSNPMEKDPTRKGYGFPKGYAALPDGTIVTVTAGMSETADAKAKEVADRLLPDA